jgi:hypothetical protein
MKKLFAILVIAGAMAACNNSGEGTTKTDSTDTIKPVEPTPTPSSTDTLGVKDTLKRDSSGVKK